MMQRFSLAAQIDEVKREMSMRDKVYAHQIAIMKMKSGEAEYRQARLAAVLKTLEWLQRNEARVRAAIGADDTPETGKVREHQEVGETSSSS